MLANWPIVSGVDPDLDITIKPVVLRSIVSIEFLKLMGSIFHEK